MQHTHYKVYDTIYDDICIGFAMRWQNLLTILLSSVFHETLYPKWGKEFFSYIARRHLNHLFCLAEKFVPHSGSANFPYIWTEETLVFWFFMVFKLSSVNLFQKLFFFIKIFTIIHLNEIRKWCFQLSLIGLKIQIKWVYKEVLV